ncbi:hypothetical protein [Psychrobacter urativorans]|uniref:DUF11 domain-containing protein n=1 Tax=Psychrobacter urativorans TaxID=45610 RepID=A0A0M3V990_9GAMM|nr:hypothetical protein [Psychrobacter urativorans]ALF60533.1 hypothetical protein AOC03_11175 [Psychrobacter urativorans]
MKTTYALKRLFLTVLIFTAVFGSAQAADALKMELQASKITKAANGKAIYVAASDAKTGETVQYRAVYTNVIEQPISDVAVTLPIPANMTFTGEAKPNSAQATVDGKNYADMPLMRKVNGKVVKIPLSEYKALRWNIKLLPAKKSADVSLNTIVN